MGRELPSLKPKKTLIGNILNTIERKKGRSVQSSSIFLMQPSKDALPYLELPEVDRYTLSKLGAVPSANP
jgi:hypothetical protein